MQPLRGEYVMLDQLEQRQQRRRTGADVIAMVDTDSSTPSRANCSLCRFNG